MEKRVIAILFCIVLLFSVASCGTSQERVENSIEETHTLETVETTDIVYDVNNLNEIQQRMFSPMCALIYRYEPDSSTGHKWENAGWGALSTLVNDFSTIEDAGARAYGDANDRHLILGSFLKECASAMYADFDGELPPIPSSDDIAAWGIQYQQGDYYYFGFGDMGMNTHEFIITSWVEHPDGSCTVEIQEWTWNSESLIAVYTIELVKNEYTVSQTDPYFTYSVASITKNSEKTETNLSEQAGDNNYYVLPDSDIRYYTESELSDLTKDELRLARNEIYARHGRKFDSEDLQEYFDSQVWYSGTIEPSDFNTNVFNEYEKSNIDTIEAVESASDENISGQNTTTGSTVSSNFSFADLNGLNFAYGSGVGAWGTSLNIYADGTFSGVFSDWDGGSYDETHPNGEFHYCEFTGRFSEPQKIDDYTYSATVEYIGQTYETGTSEIKDETLYNYTDPVGINVGDEFMFYLPGTPIEELSDFYVSWKYVTSEPPVALPSYGIYNASEAAVFG